MAKRKPQTIAENFARDRLLNLSENNAICVYDGVVFSQLHTEDIHGTNSDASSVNVHKEDN